MKQEIVHKSIADLIPYANNARTHSDTQVAQIAASIKEFGFTNPILVDGTNGIIAGHGRLMAARKLGLDTVPCIELSHLSDKQRKAYILADNRLAMNSGWDTEMLSLELKSLDDEGFDLEMLGFDVNELTLSMGLGADFEPGTEGEQGKLDEKAPIICPACSHEFHK